MPMGPAVRKTEAVPKNRPVPMTPMEGGFKLPSHCCEHKGVYLRCYTRSSTNNVWMRETHCSYLIIVMCLSFIWRLSPFFSSAETVMTSASTFEDPFFTDSGSLFSTAMDVALAGDRDSVQRRDSKRSRRRGSHRITIYKALTRVLQEESICYCESYIIEAIVA